MRWWPLLGGCFFQLSLFQLKRLPAFEEILPSIRSGEAFSVIAQIEIGRIERRFHYRQMERHGERRSVTAANGIGGHRSGVERVAKSVQIDALPSGFDALFN